MYFEFIFKVRHYNRRGAAKLRILLGIVDFCAVMDLSSFIVTRDIGFGDLFQRTSHLVDLYDKHGPFKPKPPRWQSIRTLIKLLFNSHDYVVFIAAFDWLRFICGQTVFTKP